MSTKSCNNPTNKITLTLALIAAGASTLMVSMPAQAKAATRPVAPSASTRAVSTATAFIVGTTKPTASNTGPAAYGITVFTASGDIATTAAGQTITGKNISGYVRVDHNNTTVRGNIIKGRDAGRYVQAALVRVAPGVTGTVVEFNEIYQYATIGYWQNGVGGSIYTARRNNVHDVVDMFGIDAGGSVIESNLMSAFSFHSNDADQARDSYHPYWSHNDGVQVKGGTNNTIRGNSVEMYASTRTGTLDAPTTYNYGSGITVAPNKSAITNLSVESNWLAGGEVGFQANFLFQGATNADLGSISSNRVSRDQHYYPIRYKAGYTVSGGTTNYWDPDSSSVPASMKGTALSTATGGGIRIDP